MPQSAKHADREDRLKSMLRGWAARSGRDLLIGCELAFRWDEQERGVGADPDVYVVEMPPRDVDGDIRSVRTWEEGNYPPMLAAEIVSRSRPQKDYSQSPAKHDFLGTYELWVFDPELYGHSNEQPSVRLQVYQRETNARLAKVYVGDGPFYSDAIEAWVSVIDDELVISNDAAGRDRWPTLEEEQCKRADEERKRADEERKRADEERTAKEAALARVAELEALLARRS